MDPTNQANQATQDTVESTPTLTPISSSAPSLVVEENGGSSRENLLSTNIRKLKGKIIDTNAVLLSFTKLQQDNQILVKKLESASTTFYDHTRDILGDNKRLEQLLKEEKQEKNALRTELEKANTDSNHYKDLSDTYLAQLKGAQAYNFQLEAERDQGLISWENSKNVAKELEATKKTLSFKESQLKESTREVNILKKDLIDREREVMNLRNALKEYREILNKLNVDKNIFQFSSSPIQVEDGVSDSDFSMVGSSPLASNSPPINNTTITPPPSSSSSSKKRKQTQALCVDFSLEDELDKALFGTPVSPQDSNDFDFEETPAEIIESAFNLHSSRNISGPQPTSINNEDMHDNAGQFSTTSITYVENENTSTNFAPLSGDATTLPQEVHTHSSKTKDSQHFLSDLDLDPTLEPALEIPTFTLETITLQAPFPNTIVQINTNTPVLPQYSTTTPQILTEEITASSSAIVQTTISQDLKSLLPPIYTEEITSPSNTIVQTTIPIPPRDTHIAIKKSPSKNIPQVKKIQQIPISQELIIATQEITPLSNTIVQTNTNTPVLPQDSTTSQISTKEIISQTNPSTQSTISQDIKTLLPPVSMEEITSQSNTIVQTHTNTPVLPQQSTIPPISTEEITIQTNLSNTPAQAIISIVSNPPRAIRIQPRRKCSRNIPEVKCSDDTPEKLAQKNQNTPLSPLSRSRTKTAAVSPLQSAPENNDEVQTPSQTTESISTQKPSSARKRNLEKTPVTPLSPTNKRLTSSSSRLNSSQNKTTNSPQLTTTEKQNTGLSNNIGVYLTSTSLFDELFESVSDDDNNNNNATPSKINPETTTPNLASPQVTPIKPSQNNATVSPQNITPIITIPTQPTPKISIDAHDPVQKTQKPSSARRRSQISKSNTLQNSSEKIPTLSISQQQTPKILPHHTDKQSTPQSIASILTEITTPNTPPLSIQSNAKTLTLNNSSSVNPAPPKITKQPSTPQNITAVPTEIITPITPLISTQSSNEGTHIVATPLPQNSSTLSISPSAPKDEEIKKMLDLMCKLPTPQKTPKPLLPPKILPHDTHKITAQPSTPILTEIMTPITPLISTQQLNEVTNIVSTPHPQNSSSLNIPCSAQKDMEIKKMLDLMCKLPDINGLSEYGAFKEEIQNKRKTRDYRKNNDNNNYKVYKATQSSTPHTRPFASNNTPNNKYNNNNNNTSSNTQPNTPHSSTVQPQQPQSPQFFPPTQVYSISSVQNHSNSNKKKKKNKKSKKKSKKQSQKKQNNHIPPLPTTNNNPQFSHNISTAHSDPLDTTNLTPAIDTNSNNNIINITAADATQSTLTEDLANKKKQTDSKVATKSPQESLQFLEGNETEDFIIDEPSTPSHVVQENSQVETEKIDTENHKHTLQQSRDDFSNTHFIQPQIESILNTPIDQFSQISPLNFSSPLLDSTVSQLIQSFPDLENPTIELLMKILVQQHPHFITLQENNTTFVLNQRFSIMFSLISRLAVCTNDFKSKILLELTTQILRNYEHTIIAEFLVNVHILFCQAFQLVEPARTLCYEILKTKKSVNMRIFHRIVSIWPLVLRDNGNDNLIFTIQVLFGHFFNLNCQNLTDKGENLFYEQIRALCNWRLVPSSSSFPSCEHLVENLTTKISFHLRHSLQSSKCLASLHPPILLIFKSFELISVFQGIEWVNKNIVAYLRDICARSSSNEKLVGIVLRLLGNLGGLFVEENFDFVSELRHFLLQFLNLKRGCNVSIQTQVSSVLSLIALNNGNNKTEEDLSFSQEVREWYDIIQSEDDRTFVNNSLPFFSSK